MHISSTSLFSNFAKNRLRSSARLGLKALAGLALAVTASLLMSGVASAQPTPTPAPVTVTLPTASLDNSVPIDDVIAQPVVTTNIAPSFNYVGFQGDFTFDETVVTFDPNAPVQAAGLTGGTGANSWTVAGNVLTGPGPIRTLRVLGFVNNGITALNGSGTLYQLNMIRVSSTPGASTVLDWAPFPDDFEFIDGDLNSPSPDQNNGLITITGTGPTATPTPTPTATATATVAPTPTPSPTTPRLRSTPPQLPRQRQL